MRISDWSSDVCSSDLQSALIIDLGNWVIRAACNQLAELARQGLGDRFLTIHVSPDRKSVVLGKSVSVHVDLGGRRIIKQKTNTTAPSNTLHTPTITTTHTTT